MPILGAERCEGRDAILGWFKDVLDRFDRNFESRELEAIEGPREEGNEVWLRGAVIYRAPGVPEFRLVLKETLRFEGDRIVHLDDQYTDEMKEKTNRFIREYGSKIGVLLSSE